MEKQPFEIYSSNYVATENIITKEPVEMYFLDPVKTEIIIKDEHKIEINCADLNLDTIITKEQVVERILSDAASETIIHKNQHVETYFSDSGDVNEMKKRSIKNLQVEDIMSEISEDVVFSEGNSDENNTEDVDMTKIKMEDIDIEPNNIDVERNLTLDELKVKNSDDENNIAENHKIRGSYEEDHTYAKRVQMVTRETDGVIYTVYNSNEDYLRQWLCSYCNFVTSHSGNLTKHVNSVHGLSLRYFANCLKYHQIIYVDNIKKYQCNFCLYTFVQNELVKWHILSVHLNLRPHICKGCKKTFKRKVDLDYHIVAQHHKNVGLMKTVRTEIYSCDQCTYKTYNKYMPVHMKTHLTVDPTHPTKSINQTKRSKEWRTINQSIFIEKIRDSFRKISNSLD